MQQHLWIEYERFAEQKRRADSAEERARRLANLSLNARARSAEIAHGQDEPSTDELANMVAIFGLILVAYIAAVPFLL